MLYYKYWSSLSSAAHVPDVTQNFCFFVSSPRPSYVQSTSRFVVGGDVGPFPGGLLSIKSVFKMRELVNKIFFNSLQDFVEQMYINV